MISKQKKPLKRNERRFAAASMVLVIVAVLLAAMMSGCINQGNEPENGTGNVSGGQGFSAPLEENETNEEDNQTSNSSLPDVVVATNSGGGGGSSGGSRPWSLSNESNPLIGTWVSETDGGNVLALTGYSNGTFDYEIRAPELGRALPINGKGAYLLRKDSDGTNVMIAYFDDGSVLSSRVSVKNNDLIEMTGFTLEDGQKIYDEEPRSYSREGTAVPSDHVPTKLNDSLFTMTEIGWGMDTTENDFTLHSVWKFSDDGIIDCTFLDLGTLTGANTKDLTFPFAYTVFENEDDESGNRLIIYSEEPGYGYELFVAGYELDEEEYSLALNLFSVEDGAEGPVLGTLPMWPYPYVNYKVIDKEENNAGAGLMFLSMPDADEWKVPVAVAKENGFAWAHEFIDIEDVGTYSEAGENNNHAGYYSSGFKFSLKAENPVSGDAAIRPAIGFQANFDLSSDNFDRYEEFAHELDYLVKSGQAEEIEGYIIPESSEVLTDFGIHIYSNASGTPEDITDRVSFGIYAGEDVCILTYGGVMIDRAITDPDLEGQELVISTEEERVWSDGTEDGLITADWWIDIEDAPELAQKSNPFIGTWTSDPDEYGITLVYTCDDDGTFEYEMQNLGEFEGYYPSEGKGVYIIREDLDGTNVMISYLDFGMVKTSKFVVLADDLMKITEFTLTEDGPKDFGESTYFHSDGSAGSDNPMTYDYSSEESPYSLFITNSEAGWGADFPEPDPEFAEWVIAMTGRDYYPSLWKFGDDGTVVCTFIDLGIMMGADEKDISYPFSYVIFESETVNEETGNAYTMILYTESEEGNQVFV